MTDRARMIDRVRQEVTDYLLGTLTDSEMDAIEICLESDPVYRAALLQARRDLNCLSAARMESPPPQLAQRTCELVFDHTRRIRVAASRPRVLSARTITHHSPSRVSWMDVGVAGVIFLIAGLLVLPAIYGTRFQARIASCQENLRTVGVALTEYSQVNRGNFPEVPTEGNLAAAGAYAPELFRDGFLSEPERVLCPESPQAEQKDFRVPSVREIQLACGPTVGRLQEQMGGSYGYSLGYVNSEGTYLPTRNLNRPYFAVMADAPSTDRADHQSANHGGLGQNVLFDDGHVQFCRDARPNGGSDDIFCNDRHLVAAGLHPNDAVIAPSGTPPVICVSLP